MKKYYDTVLIGGGIMSATLGVMLKELMPEMTIGIFERLEAVAIESSDAWNNAGTGHSAFCELNYTPQQEDGSVDISKAIKIASQYEESRQFWAYCVKKGILKDPTTFIQSVPHISFVWGNENVKYLKKRFDLMSKSPFFETMTFSQNREELTKLMPLVMVGRDVTEPMAATTVNEGTDVNFGELTQQMISYIDQSMDNVDVFLNHEVKDLKRSEGKIANHGWELDINDIEGNHLHHIHAKFVFIGAGGGALPLLEKSDIVEAEGYGGFPISGQWLKCNNPEIIAKHDTKVYGKASVGAPPMSVPHLDTRMINGKRELLFGPFAGFTTKFLKRGSYLDLIKSIEKDNIFPMLQAGWHNIPLTKYLIQQVMQKPKDRLDALKEYFPKAKMKDWELVIAGQRVQVIKKDSEHGGVLEFGTEVISSADGSIAGLLGASPGASTAVSIMLQIIKRCIGERFETDDLKERLKEMIPTYGLDLSKNKEALQNFRKQSATILKIK